jgi:glutathione synthase/RimK-type ligase-like ATP-grasp enzyme
VPDTLVTTDVGAAQEFLARHGRIIYKSVSGVRSIVASIDSSQRARLDQLGTGPVQFQRWIDGTDVRVHVVGDRRFATQVVSDAVDYGYPAASTVGVELSPTEIPLSLGRRLVELTDSMGLLLSGTDLRVTPDGDWYAFEMNPSPGFSFYEDATGQPIAAAIAELLCTSPVI